MNPTSLVIVIGLGICAWTPMVIQAKFDFGDLMGSIGDFGTNMEKQLLESSIAQATGINLDKAKAKLMNATGIDMDKVESKLLKSIDMGTAMKVMGQLGSLFNHGPTNTNPTKAGGKLQSASASPKFDFAALGNLFKGGNSGTTTATATTGEKKSGGFDFGKMFGGLKFRR